MTLIQVAQKKRRIFELESDHRFAGALQQLERGGRSQKVRLIVRVSVDGLEWHEVLELWSGNWRPEWDGGMPRPSTEEGDAILRAAMQKYGATKADMRYVTTVFTSGQPPR